MEPSGEVSRVSFRLPCSVLLHPSSLMSKKDVLDNLIPSDPSKEGNDGRLPPCLVREHASVRLERRLVPPGFASMPRVVERLDFGTEQAE
jgi:hypothetical protein